MAVDACRWSWKQRQFESVWTSIQKSDYINDARLLGFDVDFRLLEFLKIIVEVRSRLNEEVEVGSRNVFFYSQSRELEVKKML